MFRSTLFQVLMLECLYCITNSLNLTDSNNGLSYQEGSNATFTCTIQPYTSKQEWRVDSVQVAECGIVSCGVFFSNPSEFSFSPSISTGVFEFTINPLDSKYKESVIGCFDGNNTVTLNIDITVSDSEIVSDDGLSTGVLIVIIVVSFVVGIVVICAIRKYRAKYRVVLRTCSMRAESKKYEGTDLHSSLSNMIKKYLKDADEKTFKLPSVEFVCSLDETLAFDVNVFAWTDVTKTLQRIFGQLEIRSLSHVRSGYVVGNIIEQLSTLPLKQMPFHVKRGYVLRNQDKGTLTRVVHDDVKVLNGLPVWPGHEVPSSYKFPFADQLQTRLLEYHEEFLATVLWQSKSTISINVVYGKSSSKHDTETSKLRDEISSFMFKDIEHPEFKLTKESLLFKAVLPDYMLYEETPDTIVDTIAKQLKSKLQIGDQVNMKQAERDKNKITIGINSTKVDQNIHDAIVEKGTLCRYRLMSCRNQDETTI